MPRKKIDTGITIISKAIANDASEQIESRFKGINGLIEPKHDPESLIYAYDESFVIGGIVDRFASTAASGWQFPESMKDPQKNALKSIDLEYLFASLFITGNVYFEKIMTRDGKNIASFKPFMTAEVRVSKNDKKELIYNQVVEWQTKPKEFEAKKVVHIKLKSLKSRYYGDSKFYRCIRQAVLLGFIDKYYQDIFDGWFFGSSILSDKSGKLTKEQRDLIAATIKDKLKGEKNAFSTLIVPADLEKIELDKNFDTEAFLKYRDKLIQAIAIGLNIPYDLLVPEGSARATKAESIEEFNRDIVSPAQERAMQQIIEQISEEELHGIGEVKFVPVDTANQKEEMEVDTWYKDSGILTANEVRAKLGKDPHPDGDKLETKSKNDTPKDPGNIDTQIAKIDEEIAKIYTQYA